MAAPEREWSLAELAEQTECPARTIRFYISRGLLPGPVKGGRGAVYNEQHRQLLQRIRVLQEKGLALSEIARELAGAEAPKTTVQPGPAPWWQYGIAEDVQVWVRGDASPWRIRQIRTALAELAARLEKDEQQLQGDGNE